MSRVVRLKRGASTGTVAKAIAAFLAEHHLSPASRPVYAGALGALQEHLGADSGLTVLDEPRATAQLASWFRRRYGQTAPATRVRQLAILHSAAARHRRCRRLIGGP